MIGAKQQWIADDLVQALQKSTSSVDKSYAVDDLRRDVDGIVSARHAEPRGLERVQEILQSRYESTMLPAIRQQIADEQARQLLPEELMAKKWWPTDRICRTANGLCGRTRRGTHGGSEPSEPEGAVLPGRPGTSGSRRQKPFEVAEEAELGQSTVVDTLESVIRKRIVDDRRRSADEWSLSTAILARRQWQNDPSDAARTIPSCSIQLKRRIEAIVDRSCRCSNNNRAQAEMKRTPSRPVPDASAKPAGTISRRTEGTCRR